MVALDWTFQILEKGSEATFKNLPEEISNLHLGSVTPVFHPSYDNFPNGFANGGLQLANLDALFNFTGLSWDGEDETPALYPGFQVEGPQKTLWDLSRSDRGASEYWLWRNSQGQVITEDNFDLSQFRPDIDVRPTENILTFPMHDYVQPTESLQRSWLDYLLDTISSFPDVIGSTDNPTNFSDFFYQIAFVLLRGVDHGWFFFPLPDDRRVENVLRFVETVCSYLTVIRIVSSPYAWVVGRLNSTSPFEGIIAEIEKIPLTGDEPTDSIGASWVLEEKFYNLKRLSIIWRIPFSRPQRI
jgi:hypothetical protein